jgi:hypothetical protein
MRTLAVLTILALILSACGLKQDEEIDQPTASKVIAEVVKVNNTAFEQYKAELGKTDGAWLTQTADGFTIKGVLTDGSGGIVTVTGSGKKVGTGYELSLGYTFAGWVEPVTGLLMEGSLSATATIESLTPLKLSLKFTGDLKITGIADGVGFDVTLTRHGLLTWSYCGTVGGKIIKFGKDC